MAYYGDQKRAYQLEWMAARRNEWIEANGPCKRCGSVVDLEVDHVIRRKIAGGLPPSQIWSRSAAVRKRELAKCQVLCAICHQAKSDDEQRTTEHGKAMYRRGCRCSFCRETMIVHWRERRALLKRREAGLKDGESA